MNKTESKNQIYQAKCLRPNTEPPNTPNQILSIKPTKLNQSNQYYQTKSRETKSKLKQSPIPASVELGPAQPQRVLFYFQKQVVPTHIYQNLKSWTDPIINYKRYKVFSDNQQSSAAHFQATSIHADRYQASQQLPIFITLDF